MRAGEGQEGNVKGTAIDSDSGEFGVSEPGCLGPLDEIAVCVVYVHCCPVGGPVGVVADDVERDPVGRGKEVDDKEGLWEAPGLVYGSAEGIRPYHQMAEDVRAGAGQYRVVCGARINRASDPAGVVVGLELEAIKDGTNIGAGV